MMNPLYIKYQKITEVEVTVCCLAKSAQHVTRKQGLFPSARSYRRNIIRRTKRMPVCVSYACNRCIGKSCSNL